MDQQKIGRFIAERRRACDLTQMQLAEKLNITDRAVSKWETGRSLPDSAIMLELCHLLNISVTDLLCGEVVTMENYNKELEKKLLEMVKQKEESDKRLLAFEWVIGILSILMLLIPTVIAAYVPMEEWLRLVLVFSGMILCLPGLCVAVKIEQVAGYYACKHCGHKYVPGFKSISFAMHMGRTRYMKCPRCHKWSWQKKVVSKE